MPLHINKGKSVAQTISDRTTYPLNPDKTKNGELVTGYECDPRTVDVEFLMSKKEYFAKTGRSQKNDVLAYHLRQSFKPGEITPEEANRLGYELALRFTKGRHSFIVATHVDKAHTHNHIIFNSTNLDSDRKFVNFWGSAFAVRKLNDLICLENGLSVVKGPKPSKGHYGTWLEGKGHKKKPTKADELQQFIDSVLEKKPRDFDEFIKILVDSGCKVNQKRRKHISLIMPGHKKPIRLSSLSDEYAEAALKQRISGKRVVPPTMQTLTGPPAKLNLLIDIENSLKAKDSPGYEQWAKIFNLKQAAQTLIFLQENNISDIDTLRVAAQKAKDDFNDTQGHIHATDARLKEIAVLQKHIGTYIKTRDIYTQYRKAGYSKKFLAKHREQIEAHKAAKNFFNGLNLTKLPTMKMLQTEYASLIARKKKLYSGYHTQREFMQNILLAKQNTEMLLNCRYQEELPQEKDSNRKGR